MLVSILVFSETEDLSLTHELFIGHGEKIRAHFGVHPNLGMLSRYERY